MNNLGSNKILYFGQLSVTTLIGGGGGGIKLLTSETTKSKWLCKFSENVWTASYEKKKKKKERKKERTEIEPVTYSSSQALNSKILGSKGWRSGESARLPPMWSGFKPRRRRHMWVEFVVGSLLCSERFFSGYSGGFYTVSLMNLLKIIIVIVCPFGSIVIHVALLSVS